MIHNCPSTGLTQKRQEPRLADSPRNSLVYRRRCWSGRSHGCPQSSANVMVVAMSWPKERQQTLTLPQAAAQGCHEGGHAWKNGGHRPCLHGLGVCQWHAWVRHCRPVTPATASDPGWGPLQCLVPLPAPQAARHTHDARRQDGMPGPLPSRSSQGGENTQRSPR